MCGEATKPAYSAAEVLSMFVLLENWRQMNDRNRSRPTDFELFHVPWILCATSDVASQRLNKSFDFIQLV